MSQATYREIGGPNGLLANRQEFNGSSMSARSFAGYYSVYSYATEIARVNSRGEVFISDTYYSVTTSRHQNLCRAWL